MLVSGLREAPAGRLNSAMRLLELLHAMPVLYPAVAAAAEGWGSLVLVAGEPGAGKTTAASALRPGVQGSRRRQPQVLELI